MRSKRSPVVRYVAGVSFMAGLLFLAAGRLDYWQGWIFFLLNLAVVAWNWRFLRGNPSLAAERLRPGRGAKWWDKAYLLLSTPLSIAALIVGGIDSGRVHWSGAVSVIPYVLAILVFILGQALYIWAKKVNPFFSSVARIQADRGHAVCREGPYRFCRHPGYLGGLLFGLATPILLGSFWALVPQGLAVLLLVVRTLLEDRMLTKDLLWYAEYKQTVPALLVPGLW
jgi:protein-S-isoprenylcysteine O-methyltransferase Ste14